MDGTMKSKAGVPCAYRDTMHRMWVGFQGVGSFRTAVVFSSLWPTN